MRSPAPAARSLVALSLNSRIPTFLTLTSGRAARGRRRGHMVASRWPGYRLRVPPYTPAVMALTDVEVRVLGALIEKERTTPDGYPLSSQALLTACNQKTSRDPVTDYHLQDVL